MSYMYLLIPLDPSMCTLIRPNTVKNKIYNVISSSSLRRVYVHVKLKLKYINVQSKHP